MSRQVRIIIQQMDGYLYAAAPSEEYAGRGFFMEVEEPFLEVYEEEWSVPEDLAEQLYVHGTSDQWFSDGYEAYDELNKRGKLIDSWVSQEPEESEEYEKEEESLGYPVRDSAWIKGYKDATGRNIEIGMIARVVSGHYQPIGRIGTVVGFYAQRRNTVILRSRTGEEWISYASLLEIQQA